MTEQNPWQLWLANVDPIDLQVAQLPDRIKWMRRKYGQAAPGTTCKDCQSLLRLPYHTRTYYKCQHYGITHGEGTDWRQRWPACALHQRRQEEA